MSNSYLTYSEQLSCTKISADCEKAWHILAILLSIGRPASPRELASKCELFDAAPDYVRFLCSLPNSPIQVLDYGFVTVSMAVVSSMVEFSSKAAASGGSVSVCGIRFKESNRYWNFDVKTYFRKRKGTVVLSGAKRRSISQSDQGERDPFLLSFPTKIEDNSHEGALNKESAAVPLLLGSNSEFSNISMMNVNHGKDEGSVGTNNLENQECCGSVDASNFRYSLVESEANLGVSKPIPVDSFVVRNCDRSLALPNSFQDSLSCKEARIDDVGFKNETHQSLTFCPEEDKQHNALPMEGGFREGHSCRNSTDHSEQDAEDLPEISGNKGVIGYGGKGDTKFCVPSENPVKIMTLDQEKACKVEAQANVLVSGHSTRQKQPVKSYSKLKGMSKNLPPQQGVLVESSEYNKVKNMSRKSDQKCLPVEHYSKNSHNCNLYGKENTANATSMSPKNNLDKKDLPHFENFIIEDEEGSGGYGIVYRARRISDGKRCAIKCPHAKAHKHHANNELKMLERFGGRNFIIKYEGSLKNGDSECFILEHVDHDRPEVLKKEIDLFQLQWYGYCMFKALACLHKQGVVHRDIKPGNFLFSRKLNKGYLIDFNLAMDLQQKYAVGSKSKSSSYSSFVHVPLPHPRTATTTKDKKVVRGDRLPVNQGPSVDIKPSHEQTKSVKKRALADLGGCNKLKSQGADGSGITSTKDATSNRTPSTERMREPLPSLGRKELISLVQNVMQSPNHDPLKTPISQRKRIAAPSGKIERKIFYTSPMPLYSNGVAVPGAGLLKGKGDGKQKKEGSCVGTKGFRAPEVLFRSLHQGPKLDVWSAGVSLLYLMIGRTPFTGDPEQNVKDIAKLKGSEDLWEVAKLHDRESSFPMELFDTQSLPSVELRSWCRTHTRRPEFFKLIPLSLFDLVDKCLTVNPRRRITAEEALRHEFFASCHEILRKLRIQSSQSSQL